MTEFRTDCRFLIFFHRHEWGRWELHERDMVKVMWFAGQKTDQTPYVQRYQTRRCKNCFKVQEEVLA